MIAVFFVDFTTYGRSLSNTNTTLLYTGRNGADKGTWRQSCGKSRAAKCEAKIGARAYNKQIDYCTMESPC